MNPDVIRAAAGSTLGILALLVLVLSGLAIAFFRTAPVAIRAGVFLVFFSAAVAFGAIVMMGRPAASPPVPATTATQMQASNTVAPPARTVIAAEVATQILPDPLSCQSQRRNRQRRLSTESPASFDNESDSIVKVYWVTVGGYRKLESTIAPNGLYEAVSYIGDTWVVTDARGNCIGSRTVTPDGLQVKIQTGAAP
jgi:hypothetical protein